MRTRRRKISTTTPAIKPALGLALLLSACAGQEAPANFPSRPDTVLRGDLRGPFDGKVVEAGTGKPVEGATVMGAWAFEQGRGLVGPAGARSVIAETDSDGRYRIAELPGTGSVRSQIVRFTMVVYKRGYVAYRSDRLFDRFLPRHDFSQSHNTVKLEKMPPDASHVRHLEFIGAGGPLLARIAWELPLAAAELSSGTVEEAPSAAAPAARDLPPLDARVLITADELKAVTGFKGSFEVEPLPDRASSPVYDSLHYHAVDLPESSDAAIRVFHLPPADAEKQYEVILEELAKAHETHDLGDRSFQVTEGEIEGIGALDRGKGVVLFFTCGHGLCSDQKTTLALAKRMASRFARLGRPRPASASSTEKP